MTQAKLYLLFFALMAGRLSAQVNFISIPKDLQLFARDEDNFGRFNLVGISDSSATLRTEIIKNSTSEVMESTNSTLNAGASFTVQHKVPAMLEEFDLNIYLTRAPDKERLIRTVHNLVAGDFFIIAGQSNAESQGDLSNHIFDSMYAHPCNRAIGINFSWATGRSIQNQARYSITDDCLFGRPSLLFWASGPIAFTGIWPLKLQYNMAIESGIPVCFVNGATGGTRISENQASHTPSIPEALIHSSDTIKKTPALPYDRIYKKLHANQGINGVKGIFWYQGESDGNSTEDTALNYSLQFEKLRASWNADYPNLKKIFVLQINVGCGGKYLNVIRETQRKFQDVYKDVVVMSTVGSNQDERSIDHCHYTQKGCEKIADNLLPIVKKHIYKQVVSDELSLPANIINAYYTSSFQLCLVFDKNIICQLSTEYDLTDKGIAYLKDYFYDETQTPIKIHSIEQKDNKIYLNLTLHKKKIKRITYLPLMSTNIPSTYAGPWILNADNQKLGAFSFHEFPLETDLENELILYPNPASKNVEIQLMRGEDFSYTLFNQLGQVLLSANCPGSKIKIDLNTIPSGVYTIQIKHPNGITSKQLAVE